MSQSSQQSEREELNVLSKIKQESSRLEEHEPVSAVTFTKSIEELNLSSTVMEASQRLQEHEPVSAVAFAKAILEKHPEYVGQKASSVILDEEHGEQKRLVQDWLKDIRTLFDPSHVPEMHGRLVILGLSFLDQDLYEQLQLDGFLTALEQDLKEPLDNILTDQGRALRLPSDSVPIHQDDPLCRVAEDQLGRAAFARYLAARIAAIANQQQAYSIHLYGSWGVGKSTVLNFLRTELERDQKWLVVEFNAWQHQHIHPPWWSLMDRVFQQSKPEFSLRKRLGEYWWRLTSGRLQYIIAVVVLLWIVVLAFALFPTNTSSMTEAMKNWAAIADSASKILAVIATIWAVFTAASRSLLTGSAHAAQTYTELASDPMNKITQRFKKLIQRVDPKRVAIFIDDLDRCQSSYVIELLEGIQTLFREAPVVFVVAADRRWLNACFEQAYEGLTPWVHEPGKPLGTLFLEKVFQFSTSVPGMPEELKKAFWQDLIQVAPDIALKQMDEARQKAQGTISGMTSEGEVLQAIKPGQGRSTIEQRAIREEAVVRLAAPEIVKRTENTLKPFVTLLEPNPRAMKRLVNTYSVNRALAILSEVEIEHDLLALWTILSMRWPRLAEYLEEHPEMVDMIGKQNMSGIPEKLQALFRENDVVNVVQGKPSKVSLDANIIRECALLRA
jgi:hypothetical protein